VNSIVHFDKANSWKGVCFSPSFYIGKRFNLSENAMDTPLMPGKFCLLGFRQTSGNFVAINKEE